MKLGTRQKAVTGGLVTLPYVNLLPGEIAERRVLRKVQAGLGAGLVVAVAVVVVLYLLAAGSVAAARKDLVSARADHAAAQQEMNGLQNVGQTYALVDKAHGLLRDAGGGEVRWSSYLTDLSLRVPDSVWLTSVTVAPGAGTAAPTATTGTTATAGAQAAIAQVTFAGMALSHDDVARWLDSIAKERGWVNPYFSASTESYIGSRQAYTFASSVTVTAAALSGRYSTLSGK